VGAVESNRGDAGASLAGDDLARLRGEALASAGPHAIVDLDHDGVVVGWNRVAEAVFGYRADEALGQGAAVLFPGRSDADALTTVVGLAGQSPNAEPLLVDYLRPDGEARFVGYSVAPLRSPRGSVVGWTVACRELTELARTRQALEESEARYRTMVEGALEGIGVTDPEGRIVFTNPQLGEMVGYSPAEQLGRRVEDLLFPEDVPAFRASRKGRRDGEADLSEVRFRRKDGGTLWAIKATSPLRGAAGVYAGSVSFFTDITARREADAALRESEARRRAYFEHAAVGIMLVTLGGRILEVNPALCAITGYERSELTGAELGSLLPGQLPDSTRDQLRELAVGARPSLQVEQTFVTKGGQELCLDVTASAIRNDKGRVLELVVVVQDVTERKVAERTKDEFVSVVSHELRTPLTSIRGALGLLAGGAVGQMPATAQRMLEVAVQSTDRLVRLINDILDFERLSAGKLTLSCQPCDSARLVSGAVEELRGAADAASVGLHVGRVGGRVWADPDRVTQTLTNLIGNAIKFSPPQASIQLSAVPQDGMVCFAVEDHGPGIPHDQLEAVFGRFTQVDSSDARQAGGTGLGLAISRSLVEQHGGRIWAESVPGEGSAFRFTLPAVPEPAAGDDEDGSRPFVLVCDDDPSVRSVVKAILEATGYRVWAAATGEEAIALARRRRPDVIVLDLLMPGINGQETAVALKADPLTAEVPIVVLSVLTADQASVAGAVSWVDKPIEGDALVVALRRALGGGRRQVLVVEDDPQLAQVLEATLRRHGLDVLHARTGEEALRLSQTTALDLIVLDLVIPDGDGFSVIQWMRGQGRLAQVPVLVYTAFDLEEEDRGRLRLGRTSFLTKGRTPPEVFEARLEELLGTITQEGAQA
jgi:PAS domain S-box-containing protein